MTEEEAGELDELLTNTTPEVDPSVQGPFIKYRNRILTSCLPNTLRQNAGKSPAEIISGMVRRLWLEGGE